VNVNLDQARAARREKLGPAPTLTVNGETYDLPHSPPLALMVAVGEITGDDDTGEGLRTFARAVRSLFGESYEKVIDKLEQADLMDILEAYGEGNFPSPSTSEANGMPSKPTSFGNTVST
jgi:hypothetical protein